MKVIHGLMIYLLPISYCIEDGLKGNDFLRGIKDIIGKDPNLPRNEIDIKPYGGSFSNLNPTDSLEDVQYCLTDNACGHFEAYSEKNVPLYLLSCNHFCYIEKTNRQFRQSEIYTIENPPLFYLNCGWETCG